MQHTYPCGQCKGIWSHLDAGVLALIDRNFQGFGKELFTDAGKYVIHFGSKPAEAAEQVTLQCVMVMPVTMWSCSFLGALPV